MFPGVSSKTANEDRKLLGQEMLSRFVGAGPCALLRRPVLPVLMRVPVLKRRGLVIVGDAL